MEREDKKFKLNSKNDIQISAPSNFRHQTHIGYDTNNGFEYNNVPQDWKNVFKYSEAQQNKSNNKFLVSVTAGKPKVGKKSSQYSLDTPNKTSSSVPVGKEYNTETGESQCEKPGDFSVPSKKVVAEPNRSDNEKLNLTNSDTSSTSEKQLDLYCSVCMENPKRILFLPCKHACTCAKCAIVIISKTNICPVCRTEIQSHFEIFL